MKHHEKVLFAGRPILLDAGPLRTVLVLHYLKLFDRATPPNEKAILNEICPPLLETGRFPVDELLRLSPGRHFTQAALAEVLKFRGNSVLKSASADIRAVALDAIRAKGLTELYVPTEICLAKSESIALLAGLVDAIHIHLLIEDTRLILLTDDGRLRQHAGICADRIIEFNDLLRA